MRLTRRTALKLGLAGGSGLLLPWAGSKPAFAQFSPQIPRFERSLKIPPVLKPIRSDNLADYYQITLKKAKVEIIPGIDTEFWSYEGLLPGPTIRQSGGAEGKDSVLRFINQLGSDRQGREIRATIHLHGMASFPEYDGYAVDYIPNGYFKDYVYPNDRAATLWYHDHALDFTARNVYMGLAGMYIVEDDYERNLPLPKGDYDVPLILHDKRLAVDGSLVFDDRETRNIYGDVVLVNGVAWPRMEVANRKYRFRLLNASASRHYNLMLSRSLNSQTLGDTLWAIASDGGLLRSPIPLQSPVPLHLAMAERYEVVIDFSQYPVGTQLYLRNVGFTGTIDVDARSHALMRFDIVRTERDDSVLPTVLREVKPIDIPPGAAYRRFRFERNQGTWKINNKTWNENRIDANPQPGDVEVWDLINPGSGWVHPVHIHLVDMQMISRNGRPPRPYEQGWKDVFHVGEFETIRIVGRFGRRDAPDFIRGKYMMHCHNLVHEDHAMMAQFEVGAGGTDPVKGAPAKPIAEMRSL